MEAWKATNIPAYPFQLEENEPGKQKVDRDMRPNSIKKWKDSAKSKAARESMSIDCAKLWNNAPTEVKNATAKASAKKEIKKFTMTLEL